MAGFAAVVLKALIGKWYIFHLLRKFRVCLEMGELLQQDPGGSSATLGLIRGKGILFMKEDFIQNTLQNTA